MLKKLIQLCLIPLFLVACEPKTTSTEDPLARYIEATKMTYAPDKRVALFDVQSAKINRDLVLRGMTNLPEALADFKSKLATDNISYIDSIEVLPSNEVQGHTNAIIKLSVANLRSLPKHSAELSTQAILGTPVSVYKKESNWYLIQTPDRYLAWVDSGGLTLMDNTSFAAWKAAPKVVYLAIAGFSYEEPNETSQVVSDLVAGNILEDLGQVGNFHKVRYPDGRIAYIPNQNVMPYTTWLAKLNPTQEQLVDTGKKMMGAPYLWGGTSSKGMDCSGFTKTIYFLNGMIIPRDASQQIHTGLLVDDAKDFSQLNPGDLLFFGKPATDTSKERVVHVGMWIGENQFIHAAGNVHVSSVDPETANYDAYNVGRYLRSKRLLDQPDQAIIDLTKTTVFRN